MNVEDKHLFYLSKILGIHSFLVMACFDFGVFHVTNIYIQNGHFLSSFVALVTEAFPYYSPKLHGIGLQICLLF